MVCGLIDCKTILTCVQVHQLQPLLNLIQKQKRLVADDPLFPWHPRKRRIQLRERVRGGTPRLTISRGKDGKTAMVLFVRYHRRRHEHRRIKERFHCLIPNALSLRSSRTFSIVSRTSDAESGSLVSKTNTRSP